MAAGRGPRGHNRRRGCSYGSAPATRAPASDPALRSILTFNSADLIPASPCRRLRFLPSPADGRVQFQVAPRSGRTSNGQGPLRFSIALADNVGNAAAPVEDSRWSTTSARRPTRR